MRAWVWAQSGNVYAAFPKPIRTAIRLNLALAAVCLYTNYNPTAPVQPGFVTYSILFNLVTRQYVYAKHSARPGAHDDVRRVFIQVCARRKR